MIVSAVVPTYDRPAKLQKAVQSVINQTYQPLELVVIDDASPSDTRSVFEDIDLSNLINFRYIEHDRNKGANAARTTGIQAASGRYISFLDDDDQWLPEKIKKQLNTFEEADNRVGLVYTGEENPNLDRQSIPDRGGDLGQEILLRNFVGSFSKVMIRDSVIKTAGVPDERFPIDQDWEWYIRIGQEWQFDYVPEILVERGGGTDEYKQVSGDVDLRAETVELFLNKYKTLALEYGSWFERKWRAAVLFRIGYIAFMNDRYRLSRQFVARAIRHNPLIWRYHFTLLVTIFDRPLKIIYNHIPPSLRRSIGRTIRFGGK